MQVYLLHPGFTAWANLPSTSFMQDITKQLEPTVTFGLQFALNP